MDESTKAGAARDVFVTGASGYIGRALVESLVARGHRVHGLVRPSSAPKLPAGCFPVLGDALDGPSYARSIPRRCVMVHLVGVASPSPRKAAAFRSVDLRSIEAATENARAAEVARFVYVSVAHPAPIMRAYVEVRQAGEALVRALGCPASILRPWYVLGPGHRWPYALLPLYAIAGLIPGLREGARRLGLVRRADMLRALVAEIEGEDGGVRVLGVPEIRGKRRPAIRSVER